MVNATNQEWLTTQAVLELLQDAGITTSSQQVRKWMRSGDIKGVVYSGNNRKQGARVLKSDVLSFIKSRNPAYIRVMELQDELNSLQRQLKSLISDKKSISDQWEALRNDQKRVKLLIGKLIPPRSADPKALFALRVMGNLSNALTELQIEQAYRVLYMNAEDIIAGRWHR